MEYIIIQQSMVRVNSAYYLVEQQENNGNSSSTELINRGFIVKESNGWGMHGGQSQVFGGDYYSCLATSDDGQCGSSSEIFEELSEWNGR